MKALMFKPGDCVIAVLMDREVMGIVDRMVGDIVYVDLIVKVGGTARREFPRSDLKRCPHYAGDVALPPKQP